MEIESWVTKEAAIAVLNALPPMPGAYVDFLEKLSASAVVSLASSRPSSTLTDWCTRASQMVTSREGGFLQNYLSRAPGLHPSRRTKGQACATSAYDLTKRFLAWLRQALTSAELRLLVDEWIETGTDKDGRESPGARNLRLTRQAYDVYWEKCRSQRALLQLAAIHGPPWRLLDRWAAERIFREGDELL